MERKALWPILRRSLCDARVQSLLSALATQRRFRRCRCLTETMSHGHDVSWRRRLINGRFTMQKKLVLETTAPFQGLAELVADDEGLFAKEGLTIEWPDREKGVDKTPQLHVTSHKDAPRFASHGKLLEEGKADLYNACEWRNYSRVEATKVKSRQVGRRSIVTYAALVVRGDSPVQTPQQFANRQIGVAALLGPHSLTLQMLEGFIPRDLIKLGRVPN